MSICKLVFKSEFVLVYKLKEFTPEVKEWSERKCSLNWFHWEALEPVRSSSLLHEPSKTSPVLPVVSLNTF